MAVTPLTSVYTSRKELERRFGNQGIIAHIDDLDDKADIATNGLFDNWTTDDPDDWTVTGESVGVREISEVGRNEAFAGSLLGACNLFSNDTSTSLLLAQTSEQTLVSGRYYRLEIDVSLVTDNSLRIRASHNTDLLTGAVAANELLFDESSSRIGKKSINFQATANSTITIQLSNLNSASAATIVDVTFDSVQLFEEDEELWIELIEEATEFINQYASFKYLETDLANSRWVRTRATYVLAYCLSQRRGNPALETYEERFENIKAELERIENGKSKIPGIPFRAEMVPTMSNIVIDERFQTKKERVQRSTSVGSNTGQQDLALENQIDLF